MDCHKNSLKICTQMVFVSDPQHTKVIVDQSFNKQFKRSKITKNRPKIIIKIDIHTHTMQ